MVEASKIGGQPAVILTPPPAESVEDNVGGDAVWMIYDVENATST